MSEKRLLPTSNLGFRKAFSTTGKEFILQGFLQDIFDADMVGRKEIASVHVGNPYNIIDVNELSEDELESLLLNTELDIHCVVDENFEIAIEMQVLSQNSDKTCYPSNYVIREVFEKPVRPVTSRKITRITNSSLREGNEV